MLGNQLAGLSNLLTISQGDPLKNFLFEKVLFLLFIDTWANFFLAFRQKILCGVAKTALCLSIATICGKKKNFCQKCFSPAFLDIQRKFVNCFRKFSVQLDKTAFYESKGSFWGHNFVWTKFLFVFFSCPSKNEQRSNGFFSSKNNRQNCHNCLPRVQEGFWKNFFWKVSFFHHFALSDFCLSFRQKFVGPVVGTAFCVSIRTVCGEKFLSKSILSINYGHWSQIDQSLFEFFSAKWTTLHSTSPRVNLRT